MAETYRTAAYSMPAIADHFGVGRRTVSRETPVGLIQYAVSNLTPLLCALYDVFARE